ncbi:MAG: hypothetical protein OXF74_02955 [Rhodobacteraceae bacterium]|nr:hypothetical protein [Paracoccaceae bacterium]
MADFSITKFITGAFLAALIGSASVAQDKVEIIEVSKSRNWTVYKSIVGVAECGVIAKPTSTVNTRDGKRAEVARGDILLAITVLPNARYRQLVSFQGGYPFKKGSVVTMTIGGRVFELDPGTERQSEEWAWPHPGQDDEVVEAMKQGRDAVVTGFSWRDTKTEDTFSLLGLTAALALAESCTQQL